MKKVILAMIAIIFAFMTNAQMPVFAPYNNSAQNYHRTYVRGYNYNPPVYRYNPYYDHSYPQPYTSGFNYNRSVYGNYNYYNQGYMNNCVPVQNYWQYQKRRMIINGAAQIIRAITLPNPNYGNGYYGNGYQYYGNQYYYQY